MNEEKFAEGIRLFNDRKFFECHDLFEEIWMDESGSNSEFFRALIHIAVGCYHLNNKNYRGAKSQLIKGTKKLEPFKPEHHGVHVTPIIDSFQKIIFDVEHVVQGQYTHRDIRAIPVIQYNGNSSA